MKSHRLRHALPMALAVLAATFTSTSATAQEFPNKPLRMVVGFVAGSGVDVSGRIVSQILSDGFGQPEVFQRFLEKDAERWQRVPKQAGVKPESFDNGHDLQKYQ